MISVLYVICLSSLNTGTPLLFELGCEMSHPVSEEMVAGSFDQVCLHVATLICGFIVYSCNKFLSGDLQNICKIFLNQSGTGNNDQ